MKPKTKKAKPNYKAMVESQGWRMGKQRERIRELEAELKKANDKLTKEQVLRVNEYARAQPLIDWMRSPAPAPAHSAFTDGPERQVAYAIQVYVDKVKREATAEGAVYAHHHPENDV